MGPEGRKSDALYHCLRLTLFRCFLDILTTTFLYKKHIVHYVLDHISFIWDPRGGNRTPSITGCGGDLFNVSSTSEHKRCSTKTISYTMSWTLSPSCGTRREEIGCPLSLGAVDTFSMFSQHLTCHILHPTSCVLHLSRYILHPTSYILHPTSGSHVP